MSVDAANGSLPAHPANFEDMLKSQDVAAAKQLLNGGGFTAMAKELIWVDLLLDNIGGIVASFNKLGLASPLIGETVESTTLTAKLQLMRAESDRAGQYIASLTVCQTIVTQLQDDTATMAQISACRRELDNKLKVLRGKPHTDALAWLETKASTGKKSVKKQKTNK